MSDTSKNVVGYYVSGRNGSKSALLLGPYRDHDEALLHVGRGAEIATHVNPRFHFDVAFGTSSVTVDASRGTLPQGAFNYLLDPRESAARFIIGLRPDVVGLNNLDRFATGEIDYGTEAYILRNVEVPNGKGRVIKATKNGAINASEPMSLNQAFGVQTEMSQLPQHADSTFYVLSRSGVKRSLWTSPVQPPLVVPDRALSVIGDATTPTNLVIPVKLFRAAANFDPQAKPYGAGEILSIEHRTPGRVTCTPVRVTSIDEIEGQSGFVVEAIDANGNQSTHRVADSGYSDALHPVEAGRYRARTYPWKPEPRDHNSELLEGHTTTLQDFETAVLLLQGNGPKHNNQATLV